MQIVGRSLVINHQLLQNSTKSLIERHGAAVLDVRIENADIRYGKKDNCWWVVQKVGSTANKRRVWLGMYRQLQDEGDARER